MTNDEQIKQLSFKTSNGLLLSHSDFPWFDLKNFDILYGSIVPDVYMTNFAFAHKFAGYTVKNFQNEWMKEYNFWTSYFSNITSSTSNSTTSNDMLMKKKPRYLFYQNAKELQGRREVDGYDWRSNIFREGNEFLRFNYRSLGFNELDEYAVEQALQLVEANGGEVVIVTMGPERAAETLRKAISMGAEVRLPWPISVRA